MKLILLFVLAMSLAAVTNAVPNNKQLNDRIKTLQERVQLLEELVEDLREASSEYVFAGFTVEGIDPTIREGFRTCREEYGPDASLATTREVLDALRNGSYRAQTDGYVLSTDAQYSMGAARDKYLLELLNGSFVVVGIGGETSPEMVGEAPVACSRPRT
ncbi:MAG: hypothetical protein AAF699_16965 [Pseudomonadota bacterium]